MQTTMKIIKNKNQEQHRQNKTRPRQRPRIAHLLVALKGFSDELFKLFNFGVVQDFVALIKYVQLTEQICNSACKNATFIFASAVCLLGFTCEAGKKKKKQIN
jgi:hypothetical protein